MDNTEAATKDTAPVDAPKPTRRAMLVAFLLPVILLLPFLNRAYNIDDPMFVWGAQHVAQHPLDFFGSEVDKGNVQVPMYEWNQNPPGFSYFLVPFGLLGGWDEIALHFGAALFAGFGALGVYLLANRLCPWPMMATALTVVTPGFLVSAGTVMTDVPMAAMYVWTIHLWIRGIDEDKQSYFGYAMLCATLGTLLKYFAVTAVPLLLVYTLLRKRPLGAWMLWLLIPVVTAILFLLTAYWFYGVNLLALAAETALDPAVRRTDSPMYRILVTTVFVGGCLAPMALYAPYVFRARTLIATAVVLILGLIPFIDGFSFLQLILGISEPFDAQTLVHFGFLLGAGTVLLALVLIDLRKRWGPESILLALWVAGTLLFVVRVNHLINARVVLPLIPAIAIILVRHLASGTSDVASRPVPMKFRWPVAAGALFSLWICAGDYAVAENSRASALRALDTARETDTPLRYSGLWGFQFYLQAGGARPLTVDPGEDYASGLKPILQHGDLIVVSSDGREEWRLPPKGIVEETIYSYPNPFHVATYHPVAEAGFYSHLSGLFPYFIGPMPPEEFGLYRWTGPSYVPGDDFTDAAEPAP